MNASKYLLALAATTVSCASFAACAEYDHPEYHLVVCRPFDSWSGDQSVMDGERDVVARHLGRVAWIDPAAGKYVRGAGLSVFNSWSDDPLTQQTLAVLKQRGVEVAYRGHYTWELGAGVDVSADTYKMLREGQSLLYADLIRRQGDPDKLPAAYASRRVVGNILGAAAAFAGYEKYGVVGIDNATGLVGNDLTRLAQLARQTFAPFDLPAIASSAETDQPIQVYPVTVREGGSRGEVIIVYKAPRTDEVQRAALVQAMASIAGSDTTPEAIDAARAVDLQHRKDVWNACVEAAQCGPNARVDGAAK